MTMTVEELMLEGACGECDQCPTKCINLGYCYYDGTSDGELDAKPENIKEDANMTIRDKLLIGERVRIRTAANQEAICIGRINTDRYLFAKDWDCPIVSWVVYDIKPHHSDSRNEQDVTFISCAHGNYYRTLTKALASETLCDE